MNRDLHNLRTDYHSKSLEIEHLEEQPLSQFKLWFEHALESDVPEPNAFSLATVSGSGQPSNRIVLIKELREEGIVFYTNYESRKGQQIIANPKVSACFFWQPLSKQVRIEGVCEKISAVDSDTYYNKRPLGSRIGAFTSPQSQRIESREWLENQWKKNQEQYGEDIKRPDFWGGYIIKPTRVEFWQGQPSRLHDRFLYELIDGRWQIARLAP